MRRIGAVERSDGRAALPMVSDIDRRAAEIEEAADMLAVRDPIETEQVALGDPARVAAEPQRRVRGALRDQMAREVEQRSGIGLELLGLHRQDVVGRDIRQVLGVPWESCIQAVENEQTAEVCLIGGNSLAVTSVPIRVNGHSSGAMLTLQEVRRILSLERRVRKRVRDSGHIAKSTFADVVGRSEPLEKAKKKAPLSP